MKEIEHVLVENVVTERKPNNAEVEGSMIKHTCNFKINQGVISVNIKKWRISAKKGRNRDKHYGGENEDKECLLIYEI